MQLLERVECLSSPGQGDGWILKTAYFLEKYIGTCNWQCHYIEVDDLLYVVLSEEEKHVPYGETADITECVRL